MWSSRWNENWQGKPKYSEKTCPSATLSTTNPTSPDVGSNLGCRGGKPATNRLSYGMTLGRTSYGRGIGSSHTLYLHRAQKSRNRSGHIFMPRVGFDPTSKVFQPSKRVPFLDHKDISFILNVGFHDVKDINTRVTEVASHPQEKYVRGKTRLQSLRYIRVGTVTSMSDYRRGLG
jgi:hypothetical protein